MYTSVLIYDLTNKKLLPQIVDIICQYFLNCNMLGNVDLFNQIFINKIFINEIKRNFLDVFACLNYDTKKEIIDIIIKDINFSNHFKIINCTSSRYYLEKNRNTVVIFYYLKEKINQKDFIDNLEKNNGIYLDADNLIKDLKNKMDNKKYTRNIILNQNEDPYLKYLKDLLILSYYNNKNDLLNNRDSLYLRDNSFLYEERNLIDNLSFKLMYNSSRTYYKSIKIKKSQKFTYNIKPKIVFIINLCVPKEKNFIKKVDKTRIKEERKIIKFNCYKINNKVFNRYLNTKKYK